MRIWRRPLMNRIPRLTVLPPHQAHVMRGKGETHELYAAVKSAVKNAVSLVLTLKLGAGP